jgi:hypothetical protein
MIRLPLPAAYLDPAFCRCLGEAISTPEFVENYDRLYGTTIMLRPNEGDLRAFVEHVHDVIYLRLPDEAITGLRVTGAGKELPKMV